MPSNKEARLALSRLNTSGRGDVDAARVGVDAPLVGDTGARLLRAAEDGRIGTTDTGLLIGLLGEADRGVGAFVGATVAGAGKGFVEWNF